MSGRGVWHMTREGDMINDTGYWQVNLKERDH